MFFGLMNAVLATAMWAAGLWAWWLIGPLTALGFAADWCLADDEDD